MRRRDREVTEHSEIMHILDSGRVLHLALVDQGRNQGIEGINENTNR